MCVYVVHKNALIQRPLFKGLSDSQDRSRATVFISFCIKPFHDMLLYLHVVVQRIFKYRMYYWFPNFGCITGVVLIKSPALVFCKWAMHRCIIALAMPWWLSGASVVVWIISAFVKAFPTGQSQSCQVSPVFCSLYYYTLLQFILLLLSVLTVENRLFSSAFWQLW